jgi:hypothetical protein
MPAIHITHRLTRRDDLATIKTYVRQRAEAFSCQSIFLLALVRSPLHTRWPLRIDDVTFCKTLSSLTTDNP